MAFGGLGNGIAIVVTSVLVAQVYAERSVSALSVLNIFFGLGAVSGPALVSLGLQSFGTSFGALVVVCAGSLLCAPFILITKPVRDRSHLSANRQGKPHGEPAASTEHASVYASPGLWALGLLLLLYVGIEVGTGNWTAAYVSRSTGLRLEHAALVASGFYFALTGGRIAAAALGLRVSAERLLLLAYPGAIMGAALMALAQGNVPLTVVAVLLLGFCIAPTYPAVVARATAAFRHAPGRATSIVAAMGSLGGSVLPWLQGVILAQAGPAVTTFYTLAIAFAMLGVLLVVRVLLARHRAKHGI
jgi:fucose permease